MTRQKKSPVLSQPLADALGRLVRAGTLSTRSARRKAADTPRMDTNARIHARRFLKTYYAAGVGTDPEIGIAADGSVTLKWVHFQINPQTGDKWTEETLLTLHPDASYTLAISELGRTLTGTGQEADMVLALRIGRQSTGNRNTCVECGIDTDEIREYYHVNDETWAAAEQNKTDHMLCIGCLEDRLARKLTPSDFTDALINLPGGWPHSERMKDRLGHA